MRLTDYLDEATYLGNIGFEEMVRFYQVATDADIKIMQKIAEREDKAAFRKLIDKVLKVKLTEKHSATK